MSNLCRDAKAADAQPTCPGLPALRALLVAAIATVAMPLFAQPQLDAATLLQSCSEHQEATEEAGEQTSQIRSRCVAFLQGYIAASDHVRLASGAPSGFMQRALRNRGPQYPILDEVRNARWCLQDDSSYDALIASVVRYGSQAFESGTAADLVEEVLEAEFRC